MPSRRLTPSGSWPPSCRYLWTASRPVNKVPEMETASPTLRPRMALSETGVVREIIASIQPTKDFAVRSQGHSLAAIGPAHVTDADEKRGGQPVQNADLGPEQSGLAAETHRAN